MKSYKTVAFKLTVASPLVNVHMYNAPHVDRSLCASSPGTCLFCTCYPATRLENEIKKESKNKEGEHGKRYENVRANGEREMSVNPINCTNMQCHIKQHLHLHTHLLWCYISAMLHFQLVLQTVYTNHRLNIT